MMSSLPNLRAQIRLVRSGRSRARAASAALVALSLGLGVLGGCGSGTPPLVLSGGSVGDVVNQPQDPTIQSKHFVVDPSQGGLASSLSITQMYWGRLVDVTDSNNDLQQKDMVIGENIQTDNVDFKLTTNPVTNVTTVQILHPYLDPAPPGDPPGGKAYNTAFQKLELGVMVIDPKGATPMDLPPFTLVPRNAAVVLQLNDLLDATTITSSTVRTLTGNPPVVPFEPRILIDQNHGDLADVLGDGTLSFHTTRVIISTTVSTLDAAASNPPLPVNEAGLPASFTINSPNVLVRIPTQTDVFSGQTSLLANLTGHTVSFQGNGPNDSSSSTLDIVRSARSGNSSDLHNGFLLDLDPPYVVGVEQVGLNAPNASDGLPVDPTNFRLAFATPSCMSAGNPLKVGDIVRQPVAGVYAEITSIADPSAMQNVIIAGPAGTSSDPKYSYKIIVKPLIGAQALTLGTGELSTVFNPDPAFDQGHHACFVRFTSIASPPSQKVGTESGVIVKFSKAMDPASLRPFDTETITRVPGTAAPRQFVVGQVNPSSDITEFTFQPSLPFAHVLGQQESYYLNLASDVSGPTDLAGSPLATVLPQIQFTIDPQALSQSNSGLALRFNTLLENPNDVSPPPGGPEIRGQFLIDTAKGLLRPRSVTRFSAAADRTQPVPNLQPLNPASEQTPLSGLGSKLQQLWRYCDVGLTLLDETQTNIDVENIDWAPKFGAVIGDHYSRFEIGLCHSFFLPDETFVGPPNTLVFPISGLVVNYSNNYLDPTNDPLKIVHNRNLGYNLNPSDLFSSEHGVPMVPYPLNRTIPPNQFQYYTWRDTSVQSIGGPNLNSSVMGVPSSGAELTVNFFATGMGTPGVPYASGHVPTVGLPLLMEFRCFPDNTALGLNTFDTNVAVNFATRPNFRAFSTGGAQGATLIIKDPDLQPTATGGFNPNSTPPGAITLGVDNTFYLGQLDLVVRVSRAHTIWLNTKAVTPTFSPPVVEPRSDDQPLGTQIILAYRGANAVAGPAASNASTLDLYGEDSANQSQITFFNGDESWKSSLSLLQGAKLFQVRVSFVSNTQSLLVPVLSALGFAFTL
jgi:hypothetical protein